MRLTIALIESSFHPCNIYRDRPRGVYPGGREAKMCQTGESSISSINITYLLYIAIYIQLEIK